MRTKVILLLVATALQATACASTDHAVFVTATDIGINADAKAGVLNIGYDRTEGFVGPEYVETGATPQAFGYLWSNLSAFSPKIKQLYATGEAAALVTQPMDPVPEPA